jgi:6-phosphogluconolactonase
MSEQSGTPEARPEILVHASPEALAAAVAGRLVVKLAAVQAAGRVPSVGLTGGSIAVRIHEAVVTASAGHEDVDWGSVDVWWGDERFVPADDAQRNAKQAHDALLAHVGVSPARIHEMPASDGPHGSVDEAAQAYGDEVRSHGTGGFDVLMLGVGPDGHVASLFPGSPQLDADDTVAVGVHDSPKPPPERISLTFGALNRASEVWFVVAGADKAEAVGRALTDGADRHDVPAAGVRGQETTLWFLDRESAGSLPD